MLLEPLPDLVGEFEDVEVMDDFVFTRRYGFLGGFGFLKDLGFALFFLNFLLAALQLLLRVENVDSSVNESLFLILEAERVVGALGWSRAILLQLRTEDITMNGWFAIIVLRSLRRFDLFTLLFYPGTLKCWSKGRTQGEYLLARTALPRTILTQLPRIL